MNGALYISFFQGQLESALEQVVQLAVTEITSTVGASLSAMLLETARKEQENQRLRASVQSARHAETEPQRAAPMPGSPSPLSQPPGSHPGALPDSLRQEQKRRAVGQLKVVMERVLEFAKCELSKIVEDSFDDVLLELRKTERENEELREKLRGRPVENQAGDAEKIEPPGDSVLSPKSTDVVKDDEEKADEDERGMEQMQSADDSASPAVISVSHDWVPVLDQVFGQKWCADIWPDKEPDHVKVDRPHLPSGESVRKDSTPERKDNSQSDQPQWLQDAEALTVTFDPQQTSETSLT
ncbi:zinc finger protein, partial [Clarias magur]